MTRGGWTPIFCDVAGRGALGTPGLGTTLVIGCASAGGSLETPRLEAAGAGFFCGKSGVVLVPAGDPVMGGAEGLGGDGVESGFPGASNWPDTFMGSVVAAEILGRCAGAIFVEAGLSGLGGKLIRRVSRLGALGS